MKMTKSVFMLNRLIKLPFFLTLLFFSIEGNAQKLTSLFCDFSGVQNALIDTNSTAGRIQKYSGKAKSQIGIGAKFMEMNVNRDLHLGLILCFRQINMVNFNLHDQSYNPLYQKINVYEGLVGGTYLPRKPFFQTEKLACHFTLSAYAGLQNFAFGSNLSGGFMFLSKTGLAGMTFEFVYRPLGYALANPNNLPYYITLQPSWSIRVSLTFGKNLSYTTE